MARTQLLAWNAAKECLENEKESQNYKDCPDCGGCSAGGLCGFVFPVNQPLHESVF